MTTTKDPGRVHLIVEGRVQGVGFRYFTYETAIRLGILGWVRNRWDESVEVTAEGERAVLEVFIEQVRKGPRSSFVTRVNVEWQPSTGEFYSFRIAPSE